MSAITPRYVVNTAEGVVLFYTLPVSGRFVMRVENVSAAETAVLTLSYPELEVLAESINKALNGGDGNGR